LRAAITRTVANAEFNGANMIKAGGSNVVAFANDTGSSLITLTAVSFALSGSTVTVTTTDQVDTYTNAGLALTHVNASITALNKQLATLGSGSRALEKHRTFLAQLSDSLEAGIGNLVDADMAKESAKLQSLQVKQQLGAQALSIANQSPQILLKFFGG
jgi:flagellin